MQKTGFTIVIDGVEKYLKDFNSLNEAYKQNLEQLKQLETGTEEYYKQQQVVAQLKNGLSDFNEALKEQSQILQDVPTDSLEQLNKEYKQQLKELKKLQIGSEEYNKQLDVVGNLKNQISDFNKAIREQAKEYENLNKGVTAYKELEAETRKLKNQSKELAAQLIKLEKEGKANTKEFADLEKQYQDTTKKAQEYDETLKEIDETVGDSFRNVGNYKDSIVEAFEEAGVGVGGFGQKLKTLAANPIMLLITAVVAGLKFMFDAFKQSKTGAELFSKAAGVMNGIMAVVVKVVDNIAQKAGNLGETIAWAFENPKEALLAFKDLIVENIQNRIEGLLDTFGYLGDTIGYIFSGEFKKAAASAGEAAKSMAQVATGASKESIDSMVETVKESIDSHVKLQDAERNSAKVKAELMKSIEDLTTAYEIENQKAGDSTLSLKEQKDAMINSMAIREKLAAKQIELAKHGLKMVNEEVALRRKSGQDVNDLLESQASAYAEVKAAERDYTLAVKENSTARREMRITEANLELDILIDVFDKRKTINETLINDEKTTHAQRQALLNETAALADKSYKEQGAIIQKFTDQKINLDELVKESDATVLASQINNLGLNEAMATRLIEVVKERQQVEADFAEVQKEINKRNIEDKLEALEVEEEIAEQLAEIRFKKGLTSEEEYNEEVIKIQLDRLQKELEASELTGDERIKLENEIQLKILELKEAGIEKELGLIDEKYKEEEDLLNEQLLKGEISQSDHDKKMMELSEKALEDKIEFLKESGEENNELLEELLDEEVELNKEKNEKIKEDDEAAKDKKIENARATAAALRNISDGLFSALIRAAEGNEERQLELQRKQFQVNKAFAATDVIINTIQAARKAYNSQLIPGDPTSIIRAQIAAAFTAATGAAQLATILSQAPPMAEGGFTGRGGVIDETGQRTTGLYRLHEGEYVAPRSQVMANPGLFAALENNRITGAAFQNPIQPSQNDDRLISAISRMTSNIKVVADAEEIIKIGNDKQQIKKSKNL